MGDCWSNSAWIAVVVDRGFAAQSTYGRCRERVVVWTPQKDVWSQEVSNNLQSSGKIPLVRSCMSKVRGCGLVMQQVKR